MKFITTLSLFSALAQVGFSGKCYIKPASSPAGLFSSAEIVHSTIPMPIEHDTTTIISDSSLTYGKSSDTNMPTPAEMTTISANPTSAEIAIITKKKGIAAPSPSNSSPSSSPNSSPSSSPMSNPSSSPSPVANYYQITLDDLNKAIPICASADSCSTTPFVSECVTNARAVIAINNSLKKYKITSRGEAVAIIALMAFESESWQYNINHYPGYAGQGARNMQKYEFNSEYAKELHPADTAKALGNGPVTDQIMNDVRALVLNDDNDSFGSGFWYLVNHAPNYYNKADKLRSGNSADFKAYVVNKDGVDVESGWTDKRMDVWNTVNGALP